MNSRIIAIVRKEFIQMVRDRRTLAMVLMLPVMQLVALWLCHQHRRRSHADHCV